MKHQRKNMLQSKRGPVRVTEMSKKKGLLKKGLKDCVMLSTVNTKNARKI